MIDLAIPKKAKELIIYIWKIIDTSKITKEELIHKISFELFIFPPEKVEILLNRCVENSLLMIDEEDNIQLIESIKKELDVWQNKSKMRIQKKIQANKRNEVIISSEITSSNDFITLLDALTDKQTKNRAVSLGSVEIKEFNKEKFIIKAEIPGSKDNVYHILINKSKMLLEHNCHDFITRRAQNKQFCKHLVKFFFDLKEEDEEFTVSLLSDIAEKINKWDFSG